MIKEISKDSFKPEIFDDNDVILFHLEGCGPCAELFPVIEKISQNYLNANFYKASYDFENPDFIKFAEYYQVEGYPTLIFKKFGQVKFFLSGGNRTESEIMDVLSAAYEY
jgi:thiol-disulfide isomerase/thioredoxin